MLSRLLVAMRFTSRKDHRQGWGATLLHERPELLELLAHLKDDSVHRNVVDHQQFRKILLCKLKSPSIGTFWIAKDI